MSPTSLHGRIHGAPCQRLRRTPSRFEAIAAKAAPTIGNWKGSLMDKVFIEALEIECVIGIYDWERKIKQAVVLDIEMAFDNRKPAASDDIADTLDYKAVSKRLIQFVSESNFGLVETLAEQCCAIILEEFAVAQVKLKLSKPGAVRGARAVGVMIERRRD
jgi:dihydroneopterin aldolase